jgi:hypothetical protein
MKPQLLCTVESSTLASESMRPELAQLSQRDQNDAPFKGKSKEYITEQAERFYVLMSIEPNSR